MKCVFRSRIRDWGRWDVVLLGLVVEELSLLVMHRIRLVLRRWVGGVVYRDIAVLRVAVSISDLCFKRVLVLMDEM